MVTNTIASAIGTNSQVNAAPPRLVRAAHEFEAQMMKELLKPMSGGDALSEEDDTSEGSGGVLGEFASESLGRAVSEQGGLGIANSILHSLSHLGNPSRTMHAPEAMAGKMTKSSPD